MSTISIFENSGNMNLLNIHEICEICMHRHATNETCYEKMHIKETQTLLPMVNCV